MRLTLVLAAATGLSMLAGCTSGGALSDSEVARQTPLVIPPDIALVPPPLGGSQSVDDNQQRALVTQYGGSAERSPLERLVVARAGGNDIDGGIRSTIGDPDTAAVAKGALITTILAAPVGAGRNAQAAIPGQ